MEAYRCDRCQKYQDGPPSSSKRYSCGDGKRQVRFSLLGTPELAPEAHHPLSPKPTICPSCKDDLLIYAALEVLHRAVGDGQEET